MRFQEPVIIDAVRTPIGKRDGALKEMRPDELGVVVLRALLDRVDIEPGLIEDIVLGCVTQRGEQGGNLARIIALQAGLPLDVGGVSVNRLCGSGEQAVHFAAQEIATGLVDCAVGMGVESMTREPMGSDMDKPLNAALLAKHEIVWQGESAERVADQWQLTRRELDEFALESHRRAARAQDERRFRSQIVPAKLDGSAVEADEGVRRDTSLEKLGSLRPAFRPDGKITAGNSSQISDGAAAVLLMAADKARSLGLKPRARFRAWAVAGVDPTTMLTGPIPATEKALRAAGLNLKSIELFECNEAFASVPIAWGREFDVDWERVNVNGGAIALGHPLGASGAILVTKLLCELERRDAQFGLVTMCIGFGQGLATVIERC